MHVIINRSCRSMLLAALALMLAFSALAIARPAAAQGAPSQIDQALAAFNELLGTNLTLNDFFWSWSQETYDSTALGCPQEGQTYQPGQVVAYRFLFTYQEAIYDFRVSADNTVTVYCGSTPVESETATPAADAIDEGEGSLSNSLCPAPPEGIQYIRTRLAPGIEGRVLPGLPNNLRAGPATTQSVLGEIPGGATFEVISGPTCDETGFVWWEVSYNTLRGWTVEGRGGEYFVEPLPPQVSNFGRTPISAENSSGLNEVALLQGNYAATGALAWTQDNRLLTTGAPGSEGLWIYDLAALTSAPGIIPSEDLLTHIDTARAEAVAALALLGGTDGNIRLWDSRPDSPVIERVFLQGHQDPISAMAFSPTGQTFASTGGFAFTDTLDGDNNFAITLWDVDTVAQLRILRGHTDDVSALAFSPDGAQLVSGSADGSLRLWNTADGSVLGVVESEVAVSSVAYSADGRYIAAGYADGAVILIATLGDLAPGAPYIASAGPVTDLAFSPDGALLASAGTGGAVLVWETTALLDSTQTPQPVEVGRHEGDALSVAFSPDGLLLASIGTDNTIRLWGVLATVG